MDTAYGISTRTPLNYEEAREAIIGLLKQEGFGVLTEIDVKATMKAKLNMDWRKYSILGACNPPLAHQALTHEIEIGLLLPCNVIVYEADGGGSVVSVMNAMAAMEFTGNPALESVAKDATARLKRVLARLPQAHG
jgi:uncharacterized protein (DUF302 family)